MRRVMFPNNDYTEFFCKILFVFSIFYRLPTYLSKWYKSNQKLFYQLPIFLKNVIMIMMHIYQPIRNIFQPVRA